MLSPRSPFKVLLLDPLPLHSQNALAQAHFVIEECFQELSEAQLVQKLSDVQIVCLK